MLEPTYQIHQPKQHNNFICIVCTMYTASSFYTFVPRCLPLHSHYPFAWLQLVWPGVFHSLGKIQIKIIKALARAGAKRPTCVCMCVCSSNRISYGCWHTIPDARTILDFTSTISDFSAAMAICRLCVLHIRYVYLCLSQWWMCVCVCVVCEIVNAFGAFCPISKRFEMYFSM